MVDVLRRNNVSVSGRADGQPMVFAHGFGCDQSMWRLVAPAFEATHKVVLYDIVGFGSSDTSAFDPSRYRDLGGYAREIIDVIEALDLRDVIFVGHSASAMSGVLAAAEHPDRFAHLVLVGPSPRYTDDDGYTGGFSEEDIAGLLEMLERNYTTWAAQMAPVIVGNPDRPELGQELTELFCRADPDIAKHFARVVFMADNRRDLGRVHTPALVIQCRQDVIAPLEVGEYVVRELPNARLALLEATGHCPNLSAPAETVRAIRSHLLAVA